MLLQVSCLWEGSEEEEVPGCFLARSFQEGMNRTSRDRLGRSGSVPCRADPRGVGVCDPQGTRTQRAQGSPRAAFAPPPLLPCSGAAPLSGRCSREPGGRGVAAGTLPAGSEPAREMPGGPRPPEPPA